MSVRNEVIDGILVIEGEEFTNDPKDSGGPTKWGVTERVAREWGYKGKMEDLPREVAFQIYAERYWNCINLDEIEQRSVLIVEEMADTSVNMGPPRAAFFLQEALNAFNNEGAYYKDLIVDGDIGPATLRALDAYIAKRGEAGEIVLHRALNCMQGAFYIELSQKRQKDESFIFGWFKNRIS